MTDPCRLCKKQMSCSRRCFPKKDYDRSCGGRRNAKNKIQEVFRMAICKKCGARIIWIQSKKGRWIPADEGLIPFREDPAGKDMLVTDSGDVIKCSINPEQGTETGMGRIAHWRTCPYADDFRRRG